MGQTFTPGSQIKVVQGYGPFIHFVFKCAHVTFNLFVECLSVSVYDFLNSIPSSYLLSALLIIYYRTRFLSRHGCTRILNQVSICMNNV